MCNLSVAKAATVTAAPGVRPLMVTATGSSMSAAAGVMVMAETVDAAGPTAAGATELWEVHAAVAHTASAPTAAHARCRRWDRTPQVDPMRRSSRRHRSFASGMITDVGAEEVRGAGECGG